MERLQFPKELKNASSLGAWGSPRGEKDDRFQGRARELAPLPQSLGPLALQMSFVKRTEHAHLCFPLFWCVSNTPLEPTVNEGGGKKADVLTSGRDRWDQCRKQSALGILNRKRFRSANKVFT